MIFLYFMSATALFYVNCEYVSNAILILFVFLVAIFFKEWLMNVFFIIFITLRMLIYTIIIDLCMYETTKKNSFIWKNLKKREGVFEFSKYIYVRFVNFYGIYSIQNIWRVKILGRDYILVEKKKYIPISLDIIWKILIFLAKTIKILKY